MVLMKDKQACHDDKHTLQITVISLKTCDHTKYISGSRVSLDFDNIADG